jgi:Na+-driven multidrug efflux pump
MARFSSARPACQLPRAIPEAQAAAASATAQRRGRKEYPEGMRYVVIVMLLAIIASLGSAAVFMLRGRGDSRRMAKALALRVGLSVALFLMLMAGYFFGVFQPGKL